MAQEIFVSAVVCLTLMSVAINIAYMTVRRARRAALRDIARQAEDAATAGREDQKNPVTQ